MRKLLFKSRLLTIVIIFMLVFQMMPITSIASTPDDIIEASETIEVDNVEEPEPEVTLPEEVPIIDDSEIEDSKNEDVTDENTVSTEILQDVNVLPDGNSVVAATETKKEGKKKPTSVAASGGYFYFTAIANDVTIAKPIKVNYVAGDTIASALEKTTYTFEILDEDKVMSVNGIAGNYARSSTNPMDGALDKLDTTPETLRENLLVFKAGVDNFSVSNNFGVLAIELIRYENSADAQKYTVAKNLYEEIIKDLNKALINEGFAYEQYDALNKSIDAAEGQYDGKKVPVNASMLHGTETLNASNANVVFTNAFGTTFTTTAGSTIELLPGDYAFVASIPAFNKKATGKFTVEMPSEETTENPQTQNFAITFPGDNYWLEGAAFGLGSNNIIARYDPVNSFDLDFPLLDTTVNSTVTTGYAGLKWSPEALNFANANRRAVISYLPTNSTTIRDTQVSNTSSLTFASTLLSNFIPAEGERSVPYVVTLNDVDNEIIFTQDYTVNLVRIRTLSDIKVFESSGATSLTPAFSNTNYDYKVGILDTNTSIDIQPIASASYESGYSVYVNDVLVSEGESVEVNLKDASEKQETIIVQIRHKDGTVSEEYKITPELRPAATYSLKIPKNASIEVSNGIGYIMDYINLDEDDQEYNIYEYNLIEGVSYNYIATENTYYKTKGSFVVADGETKEINVDTNDYIQSARIGQTATTELFCAVDGSEGIPNEISGVIPDYSAAAVMNVTLSESENRTIEANYMMQTLMASNNGNPRTPAIAVSPTGANSTLTSFISEGGRGQKLELTVIEKDGEFTREQIYNFTFKRSLHLRATTPFPTFVADGTIAAYEPAFNRNVRDEYSMSILSDSTEMLVTATQHGSIIADSNIDVAYDIKINGVKVTNSSGYTSARPTVEALVPLNGTVEEEEINIELSHPSGASNTYSFQVKKAAIMKMTFETTPEDALLTVYDVAGTRIWPNEDGEFELLTGAKYTYVANLTGYVTKTEEFIADPSDTSIKISLAEAPINEDIDPDRNVEWDKFRGEDNSGVTENPVPTSAEEAQLYWGYKSSGMSNLGQAMMLDDYVVIFTGNRLQYLDSISGKLVAEGLMFASGGVIPTYADGVIYAPVASGLQAFNAKPRPQTESDVGYTNKEVMVLDSMWQYKDSIGGQATSPFFVEDGYIYGGWQQTGNPGAFVCLSITDEDPSQTHEEKLASWRWIRGAGFYWAGAHVGEKFVVVGGELQGTNGMNNITCLDVKTGEVLDSIDNVFTSENRGCVSFDQTTGRYCLVTKDAFYSVKVDSNGKFYALQETKLGGSSTSTPAVYNGRAYIACSGVKNFQAFTGSGIMVIDIESGERIYLANTKGFSQGSGLVSTAYLDKEIYNSQTEQMETGFVYVFYAENANPGGISYIIDKAGVTEPLELGSYGGVEVAPGLFTPKGAHANYNLSSLVVDRFGTMFMKLDSAFILAIGHRIEGIELRKSPERTVYQSGEDFDLTGIEVYVKYSNGTERDVSKYVVVADATLAVDQSSIDVIFPYALYNNDTPNDYIDSASDSTFDKLPRPSVSVPIVVLNSEDTQTVESVINAIDEIGELEFDQESLSRLNAARKAYSNLDASLRPAVTNYQTLLDAIARYEILTLASQNKLPASEVINDLRQVSIDSNGPIVVKSDDQEILESLTINLAELKAIENGEKLNVFIEATALIRVPTEEDFFAETALQQNNLRSTGYVLDIKVYKQLGSEGEKIVVSTLEGNVELKIEISVPSMYREVGRSFYMINIHGTGAHLLRDLDSENGSKVLIRTGKFSTYILAYAYLESNPNRPTPTPTPTPDNGSSKIPSNPNKGTPLPNANGLVSNPKSGSRVANSPNASINGASLLSKNASNPVVPTASIVDNSISAEELESMYNDEGNQRLIEDGNTPLSERIKGTAGENLTLILIVTGIAAAAIAISFIARYYLRKKKEA